jgi:predicted phosphodiesterase
MRLALLSDIHGNAYALRAGLAVLEREGVDQYVCAGDLVGYGPHPTECVNLIADIGASCVAGNHDLMAIRELGGERASQRARDSVDWSRAVMTDDARSFLERLPRRLVVADTVAVAHGSLTDPEKPVSGAPEAEAQLRALAQEQPEVEFLVLGHTHRFMAFGLERGLFGLSDRASATLPPGDRYLLNPGAIGQSRERKARSRFMLLDLERRQVKCFAARYEVRRCRQALRSAGLPDSAHHVKPKPVKDALRAVVAPVRTALAERRAEKPASGKR